MNDVKKPSGKLVRIVKDQALLVGLIVIIAVFSLATENFLSKANILLVLQQACVVGIAACAMTYVFIAGNMDLSVGAMITLSVLISVDLHDKIGPLLSVILAVVLCMIVGVINGYIVGYLKVHSMIVTLGMMMILDGVMLLYTGGQLTWVDNPNATWFRYFGRETLFGIPMQVILLFVLVIIFEIILKKTTFGIKVQAAGGNPSALRYSGSNDKRVVLLTFVLSGLMSAVAGLVMGSRTMQYQTEIAFGYEFEAISAVILGGTSLSGGYGSVYKTLIGVLIMTSLYNGFLMLGLPYYFQWIVQGVVILIMVLFDVIAKRKEGAV
ncbi:MAG: ABC transporter permease [Clostridia bacterium]|nr:ABC transporter permease [Christensenellaceae bacterium]MBQ4629027.1 ABC transporter permease [Clostridia bacterium]